MEHFQLRTVGFIDSQYAPAVFSPCIVVLLLPSLITYTNVGNDQLNVSYIPLRLRERETERERERERERGSVCVWGGGREQTAAKTIT